MTGGRFWVVLLVLVVAVLLWSRPRGLASHRLAAALDRPGGSTSRGTWWGLPTRPWRTPGHTHPAPRAAGPSRRLLVSVASGLAVLAVLGVGPLGLAAAAGAAAGTERWLRRNSDGRRTASATSRALERELPGACDLLAVCLTAGMPVGSALAGVGAAVPGRLGAELRAVADLARLGAEPRQAWTAVPPELAPLSRVLVRAGESGSTVTTALRALAAEARAAAQARTEVAVRRAGVWVLAPLGLCFLPGFLCLGVVPLVLGIAGNVFR